MPIPDHAPILTVLHGHPEIQRAILFGSLASGRARPDSDLDLAVAAGRPPEAEAKLAAHRRPGRDRRLPAHPGGAEARVDRTVGRVRREAP